MRDAYPFLRGHRARDGRPFVVQQLVTQPRFAVQAILRLQFQCGQRLRQIRHGLPHDEYADHTPFGTAEGIAVADATVEPLSGHAAAFGPPWHSF